MRVPRDMDVSTYTVRTAVWEHVEQTASNVNAVERIRSDNGTFATELDY